MFLIADIKDVLSFEDNFYRAEDCKNSSRTTFFAALKIVKNDEVELLFIKIMKIMQMSVLIADKNAICQNGKFFAF